MITPEKTFEQNQNVRADGLAEIMPMIFMDLNTFLKLNLAERLMFRM